MKAGDVLTKEDLKEFKNSLAVLDTGGQYDIYGCGESWDYFVFKIEKLDAGLNGSYKVKEVWEFKKGEKFQSGEEPGELGLSLIASSPRARTYRCGNKLIEITREGNYNFPGEWEITYANKPGGKSLEKLRETYGR